MERRDPRVRDIDRRTWEDIAPEYRKRWQERFPGDTGRWEEYEPWYRYGYEMAIDPRFEGRMWTDVEADLKTKYPEWATRYGYKYDRNDSWWDSFKDSVKEAWEHVTGRR
jgi:hypothetical protein